MERPLPAGMTIVFPTLPLEQNLHLQARLGFTGVEIWKPQLGPRIGPRMLGEVARVARDLGVPVTALNAIGEPYFDPFNGEEAYRRTLEGLKADISLCGHLGVDTLAVWEGRPRLDQPLAWHLDTLEHLFGQALTFGEAHGVCSILVEPHPFTLGYTLGGLPELCTRLGPQRFGLILDICHLSVAYPTDYLVHLAALIPYVRHLHLSDSDLVTSELHYPPGQGLVDMEGCMHALRTGCFRGTTAWDLYSWPFPERAIAETRHTFLRLLDLADLTGPGQA